MRRDFLKATAVAGSGMLGAGGAFAQAAAATGLRFVHRAELDGQNVMPPEVTFVVQQRELFSFIALAFFPGHGEKLLKASFLEKILKA